MDIPHVEYDQFDLKERKQIHTVSVIFIEINIPNNGNNRFDLKKKRTNSFS